MPKPAGAQPQSLYFPHTHTALLPVLDLFSRAQGVRNSNAIHRERDGGGACSRGAQPSRTPSLKVVTFPHPKEQAGSCDGQGTTKIAAFTLIPTWEELVVPGQIRMTLQDENDQ